MIDEKELIKRLELIQDKCCDMAKKENNINFLKKSLNISHIIGIINTQPKIGEWIPCSERLPEEPEERQAFYDKKRFVEMDKFPEYIVMIEHAEKPTVLQYIGGGEWYRDGIYYRVTAWQPLPQPYKPQELTAQKPL